ncbi:hypothetical protein B296_00042902 [Ensete ventricosum]|uniref:Uncharacterized protein n=1 Tax=Ensete ventricosum TaxID=4639 RepID=A0A426X535_ENSVE|nr:hypothetical protein B296_00042902 [Ensete ventricosum]
MKVGVMEGVPFGRLLTRAKGCCYTASAASGLSAGELLGLTRYMRPLVGRIVERDKEGVGSLVGPGPGLFHSSFIVKFRSIISVLSVACVVVSWGFWRLRELA